MQVTLLFQFTVMYNDFRRFPWVMLGGCWVQER